jgi:tetratricopeptide (TPR) repeat protein
MDARNARRDRQIRHAHVHARGNVGVGEGAMSLLRRIVSAKLLSALLVGCLIDAAAAGQPEQQLGTVSFANSCAEAVQPQLQRAVALLHSFWWEEANAAFLDVLGRDPGCAIATWGIATVAIANPFGSGATPAAAQKADAAITQGRKIGAKTERERDFIESIAAYYDRFDERKHEARLRSLADAFGLLAQKYPDDDETQIFFALYLTATQPPTDKTLSRAMTAAVILNQQFAKHPDHPGVAHYLIHSNDFPAIAASGLTAAMCYADIAPAAPHALHMPSHIFTRVGLWKESVVTNQRSVDAAKLANGLTDQLHAYDYMTYAYLQMARDKDAWRALEAANALVDANRAADYAHAAIAARYAVERNDWHAAAQLTDPGASKFPFTSAIRVFARALGAARSGDPQAANAEIARLKDIEIALKTMKEDYWVAEVHAQELAAQGWVAEASGDREQALSLLRDAAAEEDLSEKSSVSPGRLIPARELLGDLLLQNGRPAEALVEYEASLKHDPRRFRSFFGAGQAAAAAANADKARHYYTLLIEMAGNGDLRPELVVARDYLAAH